VNFFGRVQVKLAIILLIYFRGTSYQLVNQREVRIVTGQASLGSSEPQPTRKKSFLYKATLKTVA